MTIVIMMEQIVEKTMPKLKPMYYVVFYNWKEVKTIITTAHCADGQKPREKHFRGIKQPKASANIRYDKQQQQQ